MKRLSFLGICCLAMFFSTVAVYAQAGFTGPGANPHPPPHPHHIGTNQPGFTGQRRIVTTEQAKTFAHKTPVIVTGTIVQAIGGDLYTFRDSSGEIIIRIGPKEWQNFGSNIGPSDKIEISGELHRDKRDYQRQAEIHARYIKKI